MWNTDAGKIIPYYNMNMFNPSQQTYENTVNDEMVKTINRSGLMQDPFGSILKDYFIQPWILSGTGESPQGQFGEPLYPTYDAQGNKINVGLGTKLGYATRDLAESVVPGALGYAGLLNAPGEMSPGLINAVPSYGFRDIANAASGIGTTGYGSSSIGAVTKENAMEKTFRAVLGRTGIPAYTLNPTTTLPKSALK